MDSHSAAISSLSSEVKLWLFFPPEILNLASIQPYINLLSPDEKIKLNQFFFEKHKIQFALSRGLIRTILSYYICTIQIPFIKPEDLEFKYNAYGRPEIANTGFASRVFFNVSHCEGLIIFAVTQDQPIGIDVENIMQEIPFLEIAKNSFSSVEYSELINLTSEDQKKRFFEYWTLKESYLKACGKGLSVELKQFSFDGIEDKSIRITFGSEIMDECGKWQFHLFQIADKYQIGLAVKNQNNYNLKYMFNKIHVMASGKLNYEVINLT